jgi:hypothetical protein
MVIPLLLGFAASEPFWGGSVWSICLVLGSVLLALLPGLLLRRGGAFPVLSFSLGFVLLRELALRHGLRTAVFALLFSLPMLLFFMLLFRRQTSFWEGGRTGLWFPALLGLACGAAAVLTLQQGSCYFDVGAHGADFRALLGSYRSLGFHANWRTVLFSTIMLVVMITYPRKFRRLSAVLPASFFGLLLTTALNLWLNPDAARTNVPEVFSPAQAAADPGTPALPFVFLGGAALAAICFFFALLAPPKPAIPSGSVPNRASAALALAALLLSALPVLALRRVPTSVFAPVLIVSCWEAIPWRDFGQLFRRRKPVPMLFFVLFLIVVLTLGTLWAALGALLTVSAVVFCGRSARFTAQTT